MPTFVNGAVISILGRVFGRTVYILTQVLLARMLGPEGFGLYALGWTVVRMVGSFSSLGLDYGVIRFGSANYLNNNQLFRASIRQSFGLATFSGLISAIIILFIIPHLAEWFQSELLVNILYISAICLFFFLLSRIFAAATLVTQKMIYSVGLNEFVQPLSNVGFILVFAWLGWGATGSMLALLLSFFVTCFAGALLLKRLLPDLFNASVSDPWLVKPLLAFSVPVAFTSLFSLNMLWVDRLIVGAYGTNADVGVYQAISQSSLLFATVLGSMNSIFIPIITDLLTAKKKQRLEELFRVSTKWGLYISLPISLLLILKSEAFLFVAFGSDYVGAFKALQILTFAQLFNVATGAINLLLIMGGFQYFWLLISGFMLIANIVLGIILVPRLGVEGAAWGTAVSMIGLCLSGLIYTKLKLDLWPYDKRYLKGVAAIIVSLLGGLLLKNVPVTSMFLDLVITAVVVFVLFFMVLILLGIDSEDRLFITMIKSRMLNAFSSAKVG